MVEKLHMYGVFTGVLACLDGYMNIAIEQTEEYVNGQLKNKYGDAFLRGNNGKILRFILTFLICRHFCTLRLEVRGSFHHCYMCASFLIHATMRHSDYNSVWTVEVCRLDQKVC